jgi:serine acetyltransferase
MENVMDDKLERARAEIERLEHALGYLSSCTAATAEHLLSVKSSKSERRRHANICQMLLAALSGDHLHVHHRIGDQIGIVHRLSRVIKNLEESL